MVPIEAQVCAGSDLVVVGGATSAGQAPVFLAERASKVPLLIRGNDLNKDMSRHLAGRNEQTQNIEVLLNKEVLCMAETGSAVTTHPRGLEPSVFRLCDCCLGCSHSKSHNRSNIGDTSLNESKKNRQDSETFYRHWRESE